MKVPFSPPDITEEEIAEVADTLRSGWITTGPKTKRFEQEIAAFCHTEKAACLNSATASLELSLRILGIGPGDEVITTAYTYTASCSVICHVGATPVLVDTLPDSYDMDPQKVREAVNERTKAVICVDLAGIVYPYYEEIYQIAEEKKELFCPSGRIQEALGRIAVLSDGAHSFGASYKGKKSGEIADFTSFSFHAVKNLTTAEGGAAVWRAIPGISSEEIYKQFMDLSLHGQNKDALAKTKLGNWEYDIVAPYYKCNMTDIMAAIGLVQLKRYPELLKRRKELIETYNRGFQDLGIQVLDHYGEDHSSSGHLYLIRLPGRTRQECNQVITKLAEADIASNVHYKPLPMMTAYKNLGFDIQDYPNAYHMFENEITLPLHTCLTDEQVDYIISTFRKIVKEL
ncbi:MAG TPA: DegT/DnrJ/EryC1/StrS family aminotransferase [Candidatus Blautia merdavium]|uniref:DegT/DnrJ/EryC1/StrS family aminotransferase n=1 Tax=Candidatus Blautia merdavium TaxID=2838494 RepID=A0A9D2PP11_9FIRM|nr:DegT/DnrJ/EryC1/StrS family aminotransferase [Candidatus Blautia merdavium]